MSDRGAEIEAILTAPHRRGQVVGLWVGMVLFGLILLSPAPEALGRDAWIVLALIVLMGTWWVTEAIPIPATSLLPLVVLPMSGVLDISAAAAPFADRTVILLLGGFIIAKSVERWGLHERLALLIVSRFGASPAGLVGGFMVAAAVLSAWISNTSTTIMLMPVALSVAATILGRDRDPGAPLAIALVLGTAYGASIGGLATPIGTPTNLIVIAFLEEAGDFRFTFARWMMIGVPVVLVMLPAAWFVLTRLSGPLPPPTGDPQGVVRSRLAALGRWTTPERRTILVFGAIAFFWVFRQAFIAELELGGIRPFAGLTDHVIAIAGAIILFLVPAGSRTEPGARLLDWETASRIPWGVLLLFGGGLSLAAAIQETGLALWMGEQLAIFTTWPGILLILIMTMLVIFATEITSNVATASAVMPAVIALAAATGTDPGLLAVPVAMAGSCAFMFPMATAPNAIAYGTGEMTIARMAAIGLKLNLAGILLITLVIFLLGPVLFGEN
jgi:sodium-dependent dicarboxylate transporter 2/3/5